MQLIDLQTERILLPHVKVASTLWQRFRGLMFRRHFESGFGLWLEPCRSVHTMWMRVPVHVYFVDRDGMVVERRENVLPWRIVIPREHNHSVLEVPGGNPTLSVGMQIGLRQNAT